MTGLRGVARRQKRGLQIERIAGKHLVDQERDEIAGIESGFEIAVPKERRPLNFHLGNLRERVLTGTASRVIDHIFDLDFKLRHHKWCQWEQLQQGNHCSHRHAFGLLGRLLYRCRRGHDCCEAAASPLTEGVEAAVFGPLIGVGGVFATNPRSWASLRLSGSSRNERSPAGPPKRSRRRAGKSGESLIRAFNYRVGFLQGLRSAGNVRIDLAAKAVLSLERNETGLIDTRHDIVHVAFIFEGLLSAVLFLGTVDKPGLFTRRVHFPPSPSEGSPRHRRYEPAGWGFDRSIVVVVFPDVIENEIRRKLTHSGFGICAGAGEFAPRYADVAAGPRSHEEAGLIVMDCIEFLRHLKSPDLNLTDVA